MFTGRLYIIVMDIIATKHSAMVMQCSIMHSQWKFFLISRWRLQKYFLNLISLNTKNAGPVKYRTHSWSSLRLHADAISKHRCCNMKFTLTIQYFRFSDVILQIKGWEMWQHFNTLRPRQNGRHFADDTFKRISLNENVRISIKISLNVVP